MATKKPESSEAGKATVDAAGKKAPAAAPPKGVTEIGPDKLAALLALPSMKGIAKTFGENALLPATSNPILLNRRVIPTRIYTLDLALGGGIPVGLVSCFYGPKSTGKTFLVTRTIAEAQRLCAQCYRERPCGCGEEQETVCALIDVEGTSDLSWMAAVGVRVDRLLYSQPEVGEAAVEIVEALLRSGSCDVVAIDSIAFMQAAKENDRDANDGTPGAQARLLTDASRRIVSALNGMGNRTGRRPTVLLVSQLRSKVGVVFGSPESVAGGNAVQYLNAVEVRTGTSKVEVDEDNGRPRPIYATSPFRVAKSKVSAPRCEGEYRVFFADTVQKKRGQIADEYVMLADAELVGLLTRPGSKWELLGREFSAKGLIEPALMEDPKFARELYDALLKVQIKV